MLEPDKRSIGQILVEFVQSAGRPVSLQEMERQLTEAGRNPVNARMDAACYSVNMNSRVHYASGKPERRTDTGNRYDKLFRQADGRFVPYEPAVHGVWEIYSDDSGTKRVRLALEPTAEAEQGDAPAAGDTPSELPFSEFRFESHLRDYLAQNLHLFDFLGTRLRLYGEGGQGVEFPTRVGPIDILATGEDGTLYVLELKVSRGADATVGQVLRYMGAVRADIAAGRPVLGVIVASTLTDKLKMAVAEVEGKVIAVEYEMQVALRRHT